jgi:hypothetical protein
MIVGWTGHRPDLFDDPLAARARVNEVAGELVRQNYAARFLVGGQRGVDVWAALAAMALDIPFSLFLPFSIVEFTHGWSADDRVLLEQTAVAAAEVRIAGTYTERNRLLATECDVLVAVWTGIRGGGTAETIDFARAAGTPLREMLLEPAPSERPISGRGI